MGPPEAIQAITTLQSHMTSNPCAAAQFAALAAMEISEIELEEYLREPLETLTKRKDLALSLLNDIPGILTIPPDGAFYIMIDISHWLGKPLGCNKQILNSDIEMAEFLLDEKHIALAPCSPFGAPGYLRLSFAVAEGDLIQGIERIRDMLRE